MRLFILALLLSFSAMANTHVRILWNKKELSVCFGDPSITSTVTRSDGQVLKVSPWKAKDTVKIQRWLNEEYSPEKTGIHFVGFESCQENTTADVVFFYGKSSFLGVIFGGLNGMSHTLGPSNSPLPTYPSAQNFVYINGIGVDKGTVVHEAGHVVGLAHEHVHPERVKSNCIFPMAPANPLYVYDSYDAISIMNYCALNSGATRLSPGDIALLNRLYP